jgi:Transposase IS116/IS110/IS902 family
MLLKPLELNVRSDRLSWHRSSGLEPLMPLRLITPTNASVTKDAATQRGAMRKSDTCAGNQVRHKPTRRGPATGPVALHTSPYISTPSPEVSRSSRENMPIVYRSKSYGQRLNKCGTEQMNRDSSQGLSQELREALDPLLREIESLNERIAEYHGRIEQIAKEVHPEVARLKQVKGVGTLIAWTYVLTLDDPHRFRRSRDAGCYLGLRPGRRNSGQSEPQLHISKEGDRYLRTLMVQGAHYILGPFGQDSDLRRWGLKLAERGGKNAKKRAVVAVARKLAVLLHKLWVSGEVYEPLRNNHQVVSAVA